MALRLGGLGWRGWGAVCALALAAGWLLAPLAAPPDTLVQPRRDAWQPPQLPRRLDTPALATIAAAAPFWGPQQPTVTAAPGPDMRWRVAGAFGQGNARALLVQFNDPARPAQRLAVGEKLPSGHRITRIGERDYCVDVGGKEYRMGIERSES